ncbi:hypothetical protein SESBI_48975 [Sesbania bispinosa]|nr:hypothetical protein SESBI_48975 [Sesbania bispinosa]
MGGCHCDPKLVCLLHNRTEAYWAGRRHELWAELLLARGSVDHHLQEQDAARGSVERKGHRCCATQVDVQYFANSIQFANLCEVPVMEVEDFAGIDNLYVAGINLLGNKKRRGGQERKAGSEKELGGTVCDNENEVLENLVALEVRDRNL